MDQYNDLLHLIHHCAVGGFAVPQLAHTFTVGIGLCGAELKPQYGQGICAEYFPHLLQNGMFRELGEQSYIL